MQYYLETNLNKYLLQVKVIWWTTVLYRFIPLNLENLRFGELQRLQNLRLQSTVLATAKNIFKKIVSINGIVSCNQPCHVQANVTYQYEFVSSGINVLHTGFCYFHQKKPGRWFSHSRLYTLYRVCCTLFPPLFQK